MADPFGSDPFENFTDSPAPSFPLETPRPTRSSPLSAAIRGSITAYLDQPQSSGDWNVEEESPDSRWSDFAEGRPTIHSGAHQDPAWTTPAMDTSDISQLSAVPSRVRAPTALNYVPFSSSRQRQAVPPPPIHSETHEHQFATSSPHLVPNPHPTVTFDLLNAAGPPTPKVFTTKKETKKKKSRKGKGKKKPSTKKTNQEEKNQIAVEKEAAASTTTVPTPPALANAPPSPTKIFLHKTSIPLREKVVRPDHPLQWRPGGHNVLSPFAIARLKKLADQKAAKLARRREQKANGANPQNPPPSSPPDLTPSTSNLQPPDASQIDAAKKRILDYKSKLQKSQEDEVSTRTKRCEGCQGSL